MIWLTQWLCPDRHCAIATAWDETAKTREVVEVEGWAYLAAARLNGWCGICGGALVPEHARTGFLTVDDAYAAMAVLQQKQRAARRVLDALGLTVDSRKEAVDGQ